MKKTLGSGPWKMFLAKFAKAIFKQTSTGGKGSSSSNTKRVSSLALH